VYHLPIPDDKRLSFSICTVVYLLDVLEITRSKPRKGDIRHSVADISKARKKLGYSPEISLKDGLKRLLRQA
jgi:nucleoside-diphosphate-sugar epimerase